MEGGVVAAAKPLLMAAGAGLAPALIWLWFFHKQDAHPEPRRIIFLAFLAGAVSIVPSLALERLVLPFTTTDAGAITAATLAAWAIIEEWMKWFVVWSFVLWRRAVDEPIDIPLYLITAALGFAAAENALFLLRPFADGWLGLAFFQGSMRFLGATLLHALASGALGAFLALGTRRPRPYQRLLSAGGMVVAVTIHFIFNLALLSISNLSPLLIFAAVWVTILLLLAALEYVQRSPLINKPIRRRVVYLR